MRVLSLVGALTAVAWSSCAGSHDVGTPITLIASSGTAVVVAVSTTSVPTEPECVVLHMAYDSSGPVVVEHEGVSWDLDATRPFGVTLHDAACSTLAATFPEGELHDLPLASSDGWVRWLDGVVSGELDLRTIDGELRVVPFGPRTVP